MCKPPGQQTVVYTDGSGAKGCRQSSLMVKGPSHGAWFRNDRQRQPRQPVRRSTRCRDVPMGGGGLGTLGTASPCYVATGHMPCSLGRCAGEVNATVAPGCPFWSLITHASLLPRAPRHVAHGRIAVRMRRGRGRGFRGGGFRGFGRQVFASLPPRFAVGTSRC